MAIGVMNWVWTHSRSRHGARLTLLAIADCASSDGGNAWPSNKELQRKTNLTERAVRTAVAELIELGELGVDLNTGPGGCNRYRVIMTGTPAESAPGKDCPPAGSAPGQDLPPSKSAQLNGHTPAKVAPPANPAPPQNLPHPPAESAPGTIKEPIDHLDALADKLAGIADDDDPILKAAIEMIQERTGEVVDTGTARLIVGAILAGRRTTDRLAYVRKAIRSEKDPRARFLAGARTAGADSRPEWCGKCDKRTRIREADDGTPFRCPECNPNVRRS